MHDDERDPRDARVNEPDMEPSEAERAALGDIDGIEPGDIDVSGIDDGADDLLIRRISRELQAPAPFAADFDARVMAAVRAAAADDAVERRYAAASAPGETAATVPAAAPVPVRRGALRRAASWIARPRTLRVSPLAGLAVAAGLAFMFAIGRRSVDPVGAGIVATRADTGADTGADMRAAVAADTGMMQMVAFVLVAPDARQVSLVGDFNDWNAQATPLTPVKRGGVWTITVPLKPGRYNYNFVVDGTRWMPDPAAPAAPTDDFGTPASIVTVAGAQS